MTTTPLNLSRQQARSIDAAAVAELGISSLVLMENAARGVADIIAEESLAAKRIVIACGYGNNGGDGLAVARQLSAVGRNSQVLLFRARKLLSADTAANLQILQAGGIAVLESDDSFDFTNLTAEDLIVDCLLGTAVQSAARPPFDAIIRSINASAARVLSVDVPSGMNCDTGLAAGACIRADRTVTFVGMKQGFLSPEATAHVGITTVAHIGLPRTWVERVLRQQ